MMEQSEERKPVEINSAEEEPLTSKDDEGKNDNALSKDRDTENNLDLKKFSLGSATLGWCIFLMLLCIVLSFWKPDNELLKNGFEAFKLIAMTILGYIFGSNSSKQE